MDATNENVNRSAAGIPNPFLQTPAAATMEDATSAAMDPAAPPTMEGAGGAIPDGPPLPQAVGPATASPGDLPPHIAPVFNNWLKATPRSMITLTEAYVGGFDQGRSSTRKAVLRQVLEELRYLRVTLKIDSIAVHDLENRILFKLMTEEP